MPTDLGAGWSAVIVAGLTVLGTYAVARLNLRFKGISPIDVAHAPNRIEYRRGIDESVALAMKIAGDAQTEAAEAKERVEEVLEVNKALIDQNEALRREVGLLREQANKVPGLETQIRKLTEENKRLRKAVRDLKMQRR
ncbi:MAG: hypothetical protein AB7L09_21240 [Nitrospira sp.]